MLVIILVTCCSQIIKLLYTLLWLLQILLGILQYAARTPPPQRASNTFPCLDCVRSKLWPLPLLKFLKYSPGRRRGMRAISDKLADCDQGRSDGGYIGIYTPKISLPYKFFMWLLAVFFLFHPGQIVVDFEIGMTS